MPGNHPTVIGWRYGHRKSPSASLPELREANAVYATYPGHRHNPGTLFPLLRPMQRIGDRDWGTGRAAIYSVTSRWAAFLNLSDLYPHGPEGGGYGDPGRSVIVQNHNRESQRNNPILGGLSWQPPIAQVRLRAALFYAARLPEWPGEKWLARTKDMARLNGSLSKIAHIEARGRN